MQTGKLARIPLILYGTAFWSGLLAWLRETLVAAGTIDANDPELLALADEPDEVAALITSEVHRADGIQRRPNPTDRVQPALEEAWS